MPRRVAWNRVTDRDSIPLSDEQIAECASDGEICIAVHTVGRNLALKSIIAFIWINTDAMERV